MKSLLKTIVPMLLVMFVVACHPSSHVHHATCSHCPHCGHCAECTKSDCECCKKGSCPKCNQATQHDASGNGVTPSCHECEQSEREHHHQQQH